MPFDPPLHVGCPNLGSRKRLHERIDAIYDARWLTNDGRMVRLFESRIAECTGAAHAIAVSNGTTALELMLQAVAPHGGEVILPSYTFVATAHAVRRSGLTPVFVDIEPHTHTLDPARVREARTAKTVAILGVHLWGHLPTPYMEQIADAANIPLLYDAAHAFGCRRSAPLGSFGLASALSFHATKFVNSAEGGAIITNDAPLAQRLRLSRNFGFSGPDAVVAWGTNAKMSEVHAAIGITSLEAMEEIVAHNRAIHAVYAEALDGIAGVTLMHPPPGVETNAQYVVLDVAQRDRVLEALHRENVFARRYFWPGVHRMEPYCHERQRFELQVTEHVAAGSLVLPTGTAVSEAAAREVARLVREAT